MPPDFDFSEPKRVCGYCYGTLEPFQRQWAARLARSNKASAATDEAACTTACSSMCTEAAASALTALRAASEPAPSRASATSGAAGRRAAGGERADAHKLFQPKLAATGEICNTCCMRRIPGVLTTALEQQSVDVTRGTAALSMTIEHFNSNSNGMGLHEFRAIASLRYTPGESGFEFAEKI